MAWADSYNGVFIGLILVVVNFELTQALCAWTWCVEVIVDSALGLVMIVLYFTAGFLNLALNYVIEGLGFNCTFVLLGVINLLGGVFVFYCMKDTSGMTDL